MSVVTCQRCTIDILYTYMYTAAPVCHPKASVDATIAAGIPTYPPPNPLEVQRTRNTTNNFAKTLCDMATVFCTLQSINCTIRYPPTYCLNSALQGRIFICLVWLIESAMIFLVFELYDSALGERTTRMIFLLRGRLPKRNGYHMYDGWVDGTLQIYGFVGYVWKHE